MAEAPQSLFPKPRGDGAETKPAKVHANLGGLTLEQYKRLPHAEQMRIMREHDQKLTFEQKVHENTGQPFWQGKRSKS